MTEFRRDNSLLIYYFLQTWLPVTFISFLKFKTSLKRLSFITIDEVKTKSQIELKTPPLQTRNYIGLKLYNI